MLASEGSGNAMPSAKHQSLLRLLTESPDVLRAVLGWVGIDVPGTLQLRPGPDAMRDGSAHDLFADGTMVAHASNGDANADRLGRTALEVTRRMFARGDDHARLYLDVIFAYLDRAVLKKILEDEMNLQTYEPISDFLKEHIARGRTEGRTEGLREGMVRLLERRGLEPSAEQRKRLAACTDVAQLQRWFDRAVTAKTVAEVFDL